MTLYMAFLRGINVGGNHIVKMAELKRTLEEDGMHRVQTYIQSGNILFESDEAASELEGRFERLLEAAFGFPMPTMIRSADELKNIMQRCPYSFAEVTEGQSIHLSLLKREPSEEEIAAIPDIDTGRDEYRIVGREIYWFFNQSMLDSKLPRKLQKIGPATMRNWKTIVKMDELARARG
ncbi:DUF1697 domain-containing protein [Cohnella panacarvi]|uniref:DUF1697 domain-containing protein n=1 Tax=Cohnella panacarvi TaxID=400776 RepID=UPI00047ADA4F|nr:DUF1697 domain-containing protein [Cohnella panacarvi]